MREPGDRNDTLGMRTDAARACHTMHAYVCVSIGLTEHTDRGHARVGLTNQDRTKQAYIGRKAYKRVCVCVCVCAMHLAEGST